MPNQSKNSASYTMNVEMTSNGADELLKKIKEITEALKGLNKLKTFDHINSMLKKVVKNLDKSLNSLNQFNRGISFTKSSLKEIDSLKTFQNIHSALELMNVSLGKFISNSSKIKDVNSTVSKIVEEATRLQSHIQSTQNKATNTKQQTQDTTSLVNEVKLLASTYTNLSESMKHVETRNRIMEEGNSKRIQAIIALQTALKTTGNKDSNIFNVLSEDLKELENRLKIGGVTTREYNKTIGLLSARITNLKSVFTLEGKIKEQDLALKQAEISLTKYKATMKDSSAFKEAEKQLNVMRNELGDLSKPLDDSRNKFKLLNTAMKNLALASSEKSGQTGLISTLKKDVDKLEHILAGLDNKIKARASKATTASLETAKALTKEQGKIQKLSSDYTALINKIKDLEKATNRDTAAYEKAQREVLKLKNTLREVTKESKKAHTALSEIDKVKWLVEIAKRTSAYTFFRNSISGIANTLRDGVGAVLEYDQAVHTMVAVLDISKDKAEELERTLHNLAKTFGGEVSQINEASMALGRAGIQYDKIAEGAEVVIKMAKLTGDSISDSANSIVTYITVFGRAGKTVEELGDQLAYVANQSRLSTKDIATYSNYALASAKASNMTLEAVNAMAISFSNAGLNASTIGTQIRKFSLTLRGNSNSIKAFYNTLGISQGRFLNQMNQGGEASNRAMLEMVESLSQLSDEGFHKATKNLNILSKQSMTLLRNTASSFKRHLTTLNMGVDGEINKANYIAESYIGTWEKVKAKASGAFIAITKEVAPVVESVLQSVGNVFATIENNSERLKITFKIASTIAGLYALKVAFDALKVSAISSAVATRSFGTALSLVAKNPIVMALTALVTVYGLVSMAVETTTEKNTEYNQVASKQVELNELITKQKVAIANNHNREVADLENLIQVKLRLLDIDKKQLAFSKKTVDLSNAKEKVDIAQQQVAKAVSPNNKAYWERELKNLNYKFQEEEKLTKQAELRLEIAKKTQQLDETSISLNKYKGQEAQTNALLRTYDILSNKIKELKTELKSLDSVKKGNVEGFSLLTNKDINALKASRATFYSLSKVGSLDMEMVANVFIRSTAKVKADLKDLNKITKNELAKIKENMKDSPELFNDLSKGIASISNAPSVSEKLNEIFKLSNKLNELSDKGVDVKQFKNLNEFLKGQTKTTLDYVGAITAVRGLIDKKLLSPEKLEAFKQSNAGLENTIKSSFKLDENKLTTKLASYQEHLNQVKVSLDSLISSNDNLFASLSEEITLPQSVENHFKLQADPLKDYLGELQGQTLQFFEDTEQERIALVEQSKNNQINVIQQTINAEKSALLERKNLQEITEEEYSASLERLNNKEQSLTNQVVSYYQNMFSNISGLFTGYTQGQLQASEKLLNKLKATRDSFNPEKSSKQKYEDRVKQIKEVVIPADQEKALKIADEIYKTELKNLKAKQSTAKETKDYFKEIQKLSDDYFLSEREKLSKWKLEKETDIRKNIKDSVKEKEALSMIDKIYNEKLNKLNEKTLEENNKVIESISKFKVVETSKTEKELIALREKTAKLIKDIDKSSLKDKDKYLKQVSDYYEENESKILKARTIANETLLSKFKDMNKNELDLKLSNLNKWYDKEKEIIKKSTLNKEQQFQALIELEKSFHKKREDIREASLQKEEEHRKKYYSYFPNDYSSRKKIAEINRDQAYRKAKAEGFSEKELVKIKEALQIKFEEETKTDLQKTFDDLGHSLVGMLQGLSSSFAKSGDFREAVWEMGQSDSLGNTLKASKDPTMMAIGYGADILSGILTDTTELKTNIGADNTSIIGSLAVLNDTMYPHLQYTKQMRDSLNSIQYQLGGITTSLYGDSRVTGAGFSESYGGLGNTVLSSLSPITAKFDELGLSFVNDLIGGIGSFAHQSKKTLQSAGLAFGEQTIDSFIKGAEVKGYQEVKKSSSTFGLIKSSSMSVNEFELKSNSIAEDFSRVVGEGYKTILNSLEFLGAEVKEADLADYKIDIGHIDLKDKGEEETTKILSGIIGNQLDVIADTASDYVDRFRQAGEGDYETLIRVTSSYEQASYALKQLGLDVADLSSIASYGDVTLNVMKQSMYDVQGHQGIGGIIEGFDGTAEALRDTYSSLMNFEFSIESLADTSIRATNSMVEGAGTLENLIKGQQSFIDNFYSEQERYDLLLDKNKDKFEALGLELSPTREGFRDFVEGLGSQIEELQNISNTDLEDLPSLGFNSIEEANKAIKDLPKLEEAYGAAMEMSGTVAELVNKKEKITEANSNLSKSYNEVNNTTVKVVDNSKQIAKSIQDILDKFALFGLEGIPLLQKKLELADNSFSKMSKDMNADVNLDNFVEKYLKATNNLTDMDKLEEWNALGEALLTAEQASIDLKKAIEAYNETILNNILETHNKLALLDSDNKPLEGISKAKEEYRQASENVLKYRKLLGDVGDFNINLDSFEELYRNKIMTLDKNDTAEKETIKNWNGMREALLSQNSALLEVKQQEEELAKLRKDSIKSTEESFSMFGLEGLQASLKALQFREADWNAVKGDLTKDNFLEKYVQAVENAEDPSVVEYWNDLADTLMASKEASAEVIKAERELTKLRKDSIKSTEESFSMFGLEGLQASLKALQFREADWNAVKGDLTKDNFLEKYVQAVENAEDPSVVEYWNDLADTLMASKEALKAFSDELNSKVDEIRNSYEELNTSLLKDMATVLGTPEDTIDEQISKIKSYEDIKTVQANIMENYNNSLNDIQEVGKTIEDIEKSFKDFARNLRDEFYKTDLNTSYFSGTFDRDFSKLLVAINNKDYEGIPELSSTAQGSARNYLDVLKDTVQTSSDYAFEYKKVMNKFEELELPQNKTVEELIEDLNRDTIKQLKKLREENLKITDLELSNLPIVDNLQLLNETNKEWYSQIVNSINNINLTPSKQPTSAPTSTASVSVTDLGGGQYLGVPTSAPILSEPTSDIEDYTMSFYETYGALPFAEGGIVTKPTLGLIGEAGYSEAVIPLKNPNDPLSTAELLVELKLLRKEVELLRLENSRNQKQIETNTRQSRFIA